MVTPLDETESVPEYVPAFRFEETLTVRVVGVVPPDGDTASHAPSAGLVETAAEKLMAGLLLLTNTCCGVFPFPEPCPYVNESDCEHVGEFVGHALSMIGVYMPWLNVSVCPASRVPV